MSRVRPLRRLGSQVRLLSNSAPTSKTFARDPQDLESLLSKPTWSAAALLSSSSKDSTTDSEITSKQLHHLLRLSALPPPASPEAENEMLATLSSQLRFVREIQKSDTTGVEPLQSLRDETSEGMRQAQVGLKDLQHAMSQEEKVGKFHPRLRRRQSPENEIPRPSWNVLGTAEKRMGRYLVVEGVKNAQDTTSHTPEDVTGAKPP